MNGKRGTIYTLVPVLITLSLYLVFSGSIETKPTDAGFWIILALGMSAGVALTKCLQQRKTEGPDKKAN